MKVVAFHAVWTAISKRTGEVLIDRALCSGPCSSRDVANRIALVEKGHQERYDRDGVMRHETSVIEKTHEVDGEFEFWDSIYDEKWFAERSRS